MILLIIAFLLGVLVHNIVLARIKGFWKLGASWGWSKNRIFRLLHRLCCECCPKRWYCEKYKKRVKK